MDLYRYMLYDFVIGNKIGSAYIYKKINIEQLSVVTSEL
jgi:hypothetical protein